MPSSAVAEGVKRRSRSPRLAVNSHSERTETVYVIQTWPILMRDVYSNRHTTVEDFVVPIAHEIKVSRSDLRSDLRNEIKRESYRALSSHVGT